MKKSTTLFAVGILLIITGNAQAYKEGDRLLNLGVGVGTPYFGSGFANKLPVNPTLTFEKSVQENISAGGTVSYASSTYDGYYSDLKYTAVYIGARASYHFPAKSDKVDWYAGAGAGYVIISVSSKEEPGIAAASGVGYNAFGGVRYYMAGRAAVYVEIGYGSLSIANAGISIKF